MNPFQETVKRVYNPFLGALAKLRKTTVSFVMSVCLSFRLSVRIELCSHWMDFHEIWYLRIYFKYLSRKLFSVSLTRIAGIIHDNLCSFVIIHRWILLRIRNVSDRFVRVVEKIKTTLMEIPRQSSSVQITMDQTQQENVECFDSLLS